MSDADRLFVLLEQAKVIAKEYRELCGKPLGVTGEIAEFEAARILGLTLSARGQAGFDAMDTKGRKFQIKGRLAGRRLGTMGSNQEFDAVLFVTLDENYNAIQIFEADRISVIELLKKLAPKKPDNRAGIPIEQFKAIASLRWSNEKT